MMVFSKNVLTVYAGAFILASFIFTISEGKTARSRIPRLSSKVPSADDSNKNVFYSVAKSLANEALSQFQESARRNPRLAFNITMLLPAVINSTRNGTIPGLSGFPTGNLLGTTAQLGIVGLKGGILWIKAAIIQAVVLILFIIFLLTGIAYFACNIGIVSCSNVGGGVANLGGGLGGGEISNPFSRAGYDYHHNLHRTTSSIYNALDDGQKKFS